MEFIAYQATKDAAPLGTLERGLELLSRVAEAGRSSAADLARDTGLPRATAHRLATKLERLGYLQREVNGMFSLGVRVLDLGHAYLTSLSLRSLALPAMLQARFAFDYSMSLGILDGSQIIYLERLASPTVQQRLPIHVGARLPVHCTAMGKAIMAQLGEKRIDALLDTTQLTRYTARTVTSKSELRYELRSTRHRGFAVADGELIDGFFSVGVPIVIGNRVVGGMAVGAFAGNNGDEQRVGVMAAGLLRCAGRLNH